MNVTLNHNQQQQQQLNQIDMAALIRWYDLNIHIVIWFPLTNLPSFRKKYSLTMRKINIYYILISNLKQIATISFHCLLPLV